MNFWWTKKNMDLHFCGENRFPFFVTLPCDPTQLSILRDTFICYRLNFHLIFHWNFLCDDFLNLTFLQKQTLINLQKNKDVCVKDEHVFQNVYVQQKTYISKNKVHKEFINMIIGCTWNKMKIKCPQKIFPTWMMLIVREVIIFYLSTQTRKSCLEC